MLKVIFVFSYAEKKCENCKVDLKEGSENPENPQVRCGSGENLY
jgi:hypothetical protein